MGKIHGQCASSEKYVIVLKVRSLEKFGSRLHISSNGHNLSRDVKIVESDWHTVEILDERLPDGTQYLEFRIDEGNIDFDGFIMKK